MLFMIRMKENIFVTTSIKEIKLLRKLFNSETRENVLVLKFSLLRTHYNSTRNL